MNNKIKVGRAWIVTYRAYTDRYKHIDDKILSVLKWQKSSNQIYEHITQLYVDHMLYPSEKIDFLKQKWRQGLPYQPAIRKLKNGTIAIIIGHNPSLEARQVKNLESNDGKWSWEEI